MKKNKIVLPKKWQKNKRNNKRKIGLNIRKTKGYIDSFNVSCSTLLTLFLRKSDRYIVQRIDITNRAHQARWFKLFGRSFMNKTKMGYVCPYIELYIVECPVMDIILPLKVLASNKKIFTVEFGGLKKYNAKSERIHAVLWDLMDDLDDCKINRIDVAIDLRNRIPFKVHQSLLLVKRYPRRYKNTIYYKTIKEKKRNPVVNIIMYDKGKKERFSSEKKIVRLEYQFSSRFFGRLRVNNIEKAIFKIEKRIKRDTSLNLQVCDELVS